jgi:hypothetical protein
VVSGLKKHFTTKTPGREGNRSASPREIFNLSARRSAEIVLSLLKSFIDLRTRYAPLVSLRRVRTIRARGDDLLPERKS